MPKAKNLEENKYSEEVTTEPAEGLSLRDALEVAIEGTKEPSAMPTPVVESPTPAIELLQPPAEYTADEKADFLQLSRKGQEAQLRLDRSRKSKIEEIKAAGKEFEPYKKLAESVTPYLKARGVSESTEVAIQKALAMWREFEEGDPRQAVSAYLKARGIPVPKDLIIEENSTKKVDDEVITPLRQQVELLTNRIAQEDRSKHETVLNQAWSSFSQEKNAAGLNRFPDISDTEAGLQLASTIGSLVSGKSELSNQFIASVKSRHPNLTYPTLLTEAYRYLGGRIDDTETPRTQSTQSHIERSRRAASSVPGRGAQTASSGTTKKFKSYREAAAAALAELGSE